ncbi:COPII coat assembly protein SEC16 [Aspergillus undulatus]|uniref:COPII coat assembly protein SEC16 n=1 Tax=Aspergillus undulatus TaxID=1810928 RepID=UPI003CCDB658
MEQIEPSAVWNPALRSDNDDLETPVASAPTEDAPVPLPPASPTAQDSAASATEDSNVESSAALETPEAPVPPTSNEEPFGRAETQAEFREEAAELFSAAGGDSEGPNPFEPQSEPTPTVEEGGLHAHPELQTSQQDGYVPEVQTHQIEDTSENAVAGGSLDAEWSNHQQTPSHPASINGEVSSTNHDLWGSPKSVDHGDDDFFDQLKTQTKPIYFPPEESRFEEGVPLLDDSVESPVEQTTTATATATAPQPSQIDAVFEGDNDDDDGFFSSAQKPESEKEPQGPFHVHRKSTSQVMDSLGANQDAIASPLSPTAEEFDDILAAAASQSPQMAQEPAAAAPATQEDDLAAAWQAELSDDDLEVAPVEEDLAAKWQAELDDDDLLLEDEVVEEAQDAQKVNGDAMDPAAQGLGSPFGTPHTASRPKATQNAYVPHQPSTSDLVGVPVAGASLGTSAPQTGNYFQPRPPHPIPMNRAESFAERSKEGYKSPYDLPEDIAPRRKPAPRPMVTPAATLPTPPPRSSSIPAPPPPTSSAGPTPPLGTGAMPPPAASTAASAAVPTPKNFYEELPLPPVRARSRPASSGRYTPNHSTTSPALSQAPPPPPGQPVAMPNAHASSDFAQPQLQQPDRLGPYATAPGSLSSSAPVVPSLSNRYSPKPPTLQPGAKPPASPRYSPAPPPLAGPPPPQRYASQPVGVPGQPVALPFQPRTSSPLAHHEKVSYQPNELRKSSLPQPISPVDIQPPHIDTDVHSPRSTQQNAPANQAAANGAADAPAKFQPTSPPRHPYAPPSYIEEFSRRVNNGAPSTYTPPPEGSSFVPPRRSQTQSPTQQQQAGPGLSVPTIDPLKRPASAHAPSSPTKASNSYAPAPSLSQARPVAQSLEFIPPSDGQELDALERWRGAPIFKFGFGGTVLSCFPKHIPRYSAGQTVPKIKSMPGEIKTSQLRDVVLSTGSIVQHPGPLRNKSKKKDLASWLSSKIAAFENEGVPQHFQAYPDAHKRHDEKILLWKAVRVLVEHDGGAQSTPELQKSLRSVIFPHLQTADSEPTFGDSVQSFAAEPLTAASQSDAGDKSLGEIHNNLLLGEREKAVWKAADERLWGHAMIIASTLDKSIWKQLVQEFIRREVRSATGNSESLAALYEIFAGNFEESVDELVPPSARAGFQLVSKVDGQGTSKDALAGLESWKDTLGLVLSNRCPDDHQALLALGRLLLSYGRVEAAHICLIFSRAALFGGPDDHQANIVLLGVDHVHSSLSALLDDDAILLTEAYEFATSVLAGSPTSTLPHLLAFKLVHAWSLVDQGHKSEAQQYCDAIAAALKATTKPSGYHNQHLFFGVDELSARLKQTTGEGGSWISKPSMEKVSSSMWNRFSNFVAGDDSDAASTGSKGGEADIGPFAKMSGTPTVSRSPSVTDIYGQYPMPAAQPIPSAGPSRYAPNNQYAPNASPDQGRGRSSLDSQRSASFGLPYGQRRESQEYAPPSESPFTGGPFYGSPSVGYQSTPPQTSYMPPLAPVEEDMGQQAPQQTTAPQGLFAQDSPYQPGFQNSFDQSFGNAVAPDVQVSEADGYMPPVSSGYEPPSSTGPAVEVTEDSEDEKPRKKSAMDDRDDDDFEARAEALKKAEKARKDREADEAFRKAAEADAKKAAPAKSSWWGWIKGGNKEDANAAAGKPIRAKLGEESSFYYDKDLKKWVNKKDPNSATEVRATPPPPKAPGPPSRTASNSSMPRPPVPVGAGSRPPSSAGAPPPPLSSSPASSLGLPPTPALGPARSVSTGAVPPAGAPDSRPGSSAGPPPRPSTSLSHAASIDDLLGAPAARKGATARGRKKGRYVDVMAQ